MIFVVIFEQVNMPLSLQVGKSQQRVMKRNGKDNDGTVRVQYSGY